MLKAPAHNPTDPQASPAYQALPNPSALHPLRRPDQRFMDSEVFTNKFAAHLGGPMEKVTRRTMKRWSGMFYFISRYPSFAVLAFSAVICATATTDLGASDCEALTSCRRVRTRPHGPRRSMERLQPERNWPTRYGDREVGSSHRCDIHVYHPPRTSHGSTSMSCYLD